VPLVPLYVWLDKTGVAEIEVVGPLVSQARSYNEQVEDLVTQYAVSYIERWPRVLANLNWTQIAELGKDINR
ncbi:MAG: hypothetical protein GX620_10465, partial [Chloroflexi bacterium]|nr:hypothetical protein [Chloroflexota bacterium]